MIFSNYPYFINILKKKIDKEEYFLSKYFFMSDLFYSNIKYFCFILEFDLNSLKKKKLDNKKIFKRFLDNLIETKTNENISFENLKNKLNENIETIKELEKSFRLTEKNGLKSESFYQKIFNKSFDKLVDLFKEINECINFDLIIPHTIEHTEIKELPDYISGFNLIGRNVSIKEIKNTVNVNHSLSNSIILKDKSINKIYIADINFVNQNHEDSFKTEFILNSFSNYITGTDLFKIKVTQKKYSELEHIHNKEEDFYIKRENVSEKLSKFVIEKNSGYLFLVGALGTGKTTLIKDFEYENKSYKIYKTNIFENISFKKNLKEITEKILVKSEDILDNSINCLRFFHKIKSNQKIIIVFEDIHLLQKIDDFLKIFPQKLPENIYVFFTMSARENIILPMLENRELYYLPSLSYNEVKSLVSKISNYNTIITNKTIDGIIKSTYGFPLYIKIYLQQFVDTKNSYYIFKQSQVENRFIQLINQFQEYTIRFDKKLKDYARFFFTLLAISNEGFTKNEIISIFPAISNILIETYIDRSSEFLVKVNSRYKLSSDIFNEICLEKICTKEEILFLNNKIIDFFEPWDKKVSSLAIKNLPYHYLQINDLDKLKNLLLSSFTKSKFKLYPKETLNDIEILISEMVKKTDNIMDIFNFIFIYQRLKENNKRELLHILDITESGKYDQVIVASYEINKSLERFYQLLVIGYIAVDNKKLIEARSAVKRMINVPNYLIDSHNSEIIFKICSEMLSKGIFDIINLPRSRDDGVNIIKNLKETEYSYKVIEIILKLLESLPNEIDKSVMLEALLNRIMEFESLITIEKFYKDILLIIEKIKNENVKDRLYHVYILCILKRPEVYNAFLNTLLEIKDKLNGSLFKYLYYLSLSIVFLKLNQEKISKDFVLKSISFIEDLENLNHLQFMISNLIFTLKTYEKAYFYEKITKRIFKLIDNTSFSLDALQNKLNLINSFKKSSIYKNEIKDIVNKVINLDFFQIKSFESERAKNINTSQLIKSTVDALFKIQDKRIFNPLLKKVIKTFENKDYLHQIYLYMFLLDYLPNEDLLIKLYRILDIDLNIDSKIFTIIENISYKNIFASEISDLVMKKTLLIDKDNLTDLIIHIVSNMDKKTINPGQGFAENIYEICNNISSVKNKLKIFSHLSYFLVNINQKESGLQLTRKVFTILLDQDDETKYLIIKEILEHIGRIKDTFRLYYCLSDVLVNIYNISHYIKDDKVNIKIAQEVFKDTTKLNFTDLKNIFYRTLEVANKTVNANSKMQLINLVRKYLPYVDEKNFLIDILQKSILISEENFSKSDLKLMTLSSLGFKNINGLNYEKGKELFIKLISEISFSSYEDYVAEVIIYFSSLVHKIENIEDGVIFFRLISEADIYMQNENLILKTYVNVINHLVKIADVKLIYQSYSNLIRVSIKLESSYYKSEYLVKLVSGITQFKIDNQVIDLLNKIFNLSHFIKDEKDIIHFYKSMIISINKSLSLHGLDDSLKESFNEKINSYLKSIEKSIENINDISIKSEIYSLIALSDFKFNKSENQYKVFFKKSIELIDNLIDSDNKIAIETLTALRMMSTNDKLGGKFLIEKVVKSIFSQKDEKIKFNYFEMFYNHKNHISKSDEYRENLEYMFGNNLMFKSEVLNLKKYILAFNYYYEKKDIDKTYEFIQYSENILSKNESYESIDQKINLGISLIKINQYDRGSNILISLFEEINKKPRRIMYELIIKLFNLVSVLGESKYKPELLQKILSEIDKINIREISENDLYVLAYSYANKSIFNRFEYVFKNLENVYQKEKIIEAFIEISFVKEDNETLFKLIPLALFSSKISDKIIAYIILNTDDKEIIQNLTEQY